MHEKIYSDVTESNKFDKMHMSIQIFLLTFINQQLVFSNPVVNTNYGTVEGISIPIHTGQIIDSFMGIPYATPPVGDLRFTESVEPEPWEDTLLAHEPGNACIQGLLTGVHMFHFGWDKFNEDCLTLNIYTPQTNDTELLPVLVFIHGGDFYNGVSFIYPGYMQAAYGVVVVTVNYRLGIYGFATTEDDVLTGNKGLLDQALALRFIQENIEAFGGDPSRVTVSGESAGGASVGLHLISAVSEGLFQQAILQSGTELGYWVMQFPEEQPSNYLRQVAEKVNCTIESSQEMVDCLRTIDAQTLYTASAIFNCTDGFDCNSFRPTIDGTFLTDYPSVLRESGQFIKVPEMIGVNEDEGSMWLWELNDYGAEHEDGVNRTVFDEAIATEMAIVAPRWPDPEREEDAVQATRFQYADWPYFYDPMKNREMFVKMYGDLYFGYSADLQAKSHSGEAPVYYYVFDYQEEDSRYPEYFGSYHSAELSFTFGAPWLTLEENEIALNHSQADPRNGTTPDYTETDRNVSTFMMSLWTNFAKYGNPTPEPVGPDEDSQITWPLFTQGNLTYAYLSDNPDVCIDYRQDYYAFWAHYFQYIAQGEPFVNQQE